MTGVSPPRRRRRVPPATAPYECPDQAPPPPAPRTLAAQPSTAAARPGWRDHRHHRQQRAQRPTAPPGRPRHRRDRPRPVHRYGVRGLLSQDAIPARYQSTAEASSTPPRACSSYLGNGWESLSSGQKADIESFAAGSTTAAAADPSCLDDVVVLEVFELEFPEMCVYDTGDFRVFYKVGGSGEVDPADSGGTHGGNRIRTTSIGWWRTSMWRGRSTSRRSATGSPPEPRRCRCSCCRSRAASLSPFADDGLRHFIVVETSDEGEDYGRATSCSTLRSTRTRRCTTSGTFLADFSGFIDDRESTMWWLEASANWAAHQAALTDDDPNGGDKGVGLRISTAPAVRCAGELLLGVRLGRRARPRRRRLVAGTTHGRTGRSSSPSGSSSSTATTSCSTSGRHRQNGGDGRKGFAEVIGDLLVDERPPSKRSAAVLAGQYLFADDSGLDGPTASDSHLDSRLPRHRKLAVVARRDDEATQSADSFRAAPPGPVDDGSSPRGRAG